MTVWDDLVGQQPVVDELARAADRGSGALRGDAAIGMTHAWLITGPPGSGRSNAARAFAAALQCEHGGCGECHSCRTVLAGTHPDVTIVRPTLMSFGVDATRDMVRRAALAPYGSRWQIVLVEDADRLTDQALNALLKAIEEPAPRTVWLLCAPTPDDLLPTIRSRCRHVRLRTPPVDAIAHVLIERDGIEPSAARAAAFAAQGHIGRARWLARDEAARGRRDRVLGIPARLVGVEPCLAAAAELVAGADAESRDSTASVDEGETEDLRRALGFGTTGRAPRHTEAALKDLDSRQKKRSKRQARDALDRSLLDLVGYYRDVLARQLGSSVHLVNADRAAEIEATARETTPETTLRHIDALLSCREALDANAAPPLALESTLLALRRG
jgi:DNA polymerase-3 subunit delta'